MHRAFPKSVQRGTYIDSEVRTTFSRTITAEQNSELMRVPSYDEVRSVVSHLNPDKSPGPDGFNGAFFKAFWDIIGMDLVRAIQSIFLGNNLLRQVNDTFVTLVPKVKNASSLDQFRPIS